MAARAFLVLRLVLILGTFDLAAAQTSVSSSPAPPLPDLPLDTYEESTRGKVADAYRGARENPESALASGRLGMVLYAHEQYQPAVRCFERAHALAAGDGRWAYYLGRAQANLARYDSAAASLQGALERRPGYLPARLKRAESLFEAGRSDESRVLYQALVMEHPELAEAHYGLGRVLAQAGQLAAAVPHLQRASELFPGFGAAHYALARAYREGGESEKALAHLARYRESKLGWPTVPDPLLVAALELNTGATARLRKGIQLAEAGELEAAAKEHEGALVADPRLLQAHVNLIRLYGQLGQPAQAEKHYEAAIAIDPNLAEVHYNYGVLLTVEGKPEEAAAAFRRALDRNPAYAEAHDNYAYLLMTSGRLEEAKHHYEAALESRPGDRLAHFNLGRILVQRGDLAEAIAHLRQTLVPEDEETPRCTYALAAALARAGSREEALEYMREAREKAKARGQADLLVAIERDLRALEKMGPR